MKHLRRFTTSGFTMMEIIISTAIWLLVAAAVVTCFDLILRLENNISIDMVWAKQGETVQEMIGDEIRDADGTIQVMSQGSFANARLQITHAGVTEAFYVADSDNNLATLGDNCLYYSPDITKNKVQIIAKTVGQFSTSGYSSFFTGGDDTVPVRVMMRIGDYDNNTQSTRFKGLGFQNTMINASFTRRVKPNI